jgi:hypothetical protein
MKRWPVAPLFLVFTLVFVDAARAQSSTSQTTCPSLRDFEFAPTSSAVLTASRDAMWDAADRALKKWSDSVYFAKPAVRRRNSALSDASASSIAQTAPSPEKLTCYFERRIGKRDSRIAFRLVAATVKGRTSSMRLTVYRLSQTKGSVQRTWTSNPTGSDVFAAQFIDILRGHLPVARR